MRFDDYFIAPEIKEQLAKLELKKPTDIQFKAIPYILKGEDVLGIAQTGTGKTAAFVIPILDAIHKDRRRQGIQCLVMVPTRELAIQIDEEFKRIGKKTRVKSFALFGGVEQESQLKQLASHLDVLVTTPGRLFDLNNQEQIDFRGLKTLVLDEADHMLDLGFYRDIEDVIRFLPRGRQTLFFSATIDEKIKKLAYSLVRNAIRIQISPKDPISKKIDHAVMWVEMDDKRFYLERILKENTESKVLVFVRTKVRAERVFKAMERANLRTVTIHGDKDQIERKKALTAFKNGDEKVLIATDVSARGIDVKKVDLVVNYDIPEQPETYVHRIGRTGRGNHKGQAISFSSKEEKELLLKIQEYITKPIKVLTVDKDEHEETLLTSTEKTDDWKSIMTEIDSLKEEVPKRKKKKK
ncbi:MAG: DEAD/DEAH box helicase [Cyclobacteriaceae bacterium]